MGMGVINRYLGVIAAAGVLLISGITGKAGELENYSVSWIGNTYLGGNKGWVPQDVQDIFVIHAENTETLLSLAWRTPLAS